jgi:anti-anti-sigma factor
VADVERGPAPPLQVEVAWDGAAATVTVTGELDAATASGLAGRLMSVAAARPERLVLDLGRLVFADVAGVRALDGAHRALQAWCPVILRRPWPSARRSFSLTGHREN